MITHSTMTKSLSDDPRRLRSLVARASSLASDHELTSVMAGLTAPVGDPLFPDFIDFLQSALRMEDGIFRMTRERAVVYLADVDQGLAAQVLDRLIVISSASTRLSTNPARRGSISRFVPKRPP